MLTLKTPKKVIKPVVQKVNNFWDNREQIVDKARKEKEKKDLRKGA
jgi:hypothetical protein